jgi:hypothetical protein
MPGYDTHPPLEEIRTTVPDLRARKWGKKDLVTFKSPNTSVIAWIEYQVIKEEKRLDALVLN